MTTSEMARREGVTESCVRKWITSGKIKATRTDCGWFIPDDQQRPENLPPKDRWKAHKRPMGRPTYRRQRTHISQMSEKEKGDVLWNNHISQSPKSVRWFARTFGVSVDEIRAMYDRELKQRLHSRQTEGGDSDA